MTMLKTVTFAKKISTAEIETAGWDRNRRSPSMEGEKNQQLLQHDSYLLIFSFFMPQRKEIGPAHWMLITI